VGYDPANLLGAGARPCYLQYYLHKQGIIIVGGEMQARRAAARFLVGTIVYLAIVLGLRRLGVPPLAAFAVALVVGLIISRLVDRRMDRR
jgi:hypothetical protein